MTNEAGKNALQSRLVYMVTWHPFWMRLAIVNSPMA